MRQWCTHWYESIMSLPSCYDAAKADVLKVKLVDLEPFTPANLLKLRSVGGLPYSAVTENAEYLPAVCDTPLRVIRIIARVPKKVAFYLASHGDSTLTKIVRSVYRIIRGTVPDEKELAE